MYSCPCGDQPVAIADERLKETYLDGAYWCSGVIALLDFSGKVRYIWNPYSLLELKQKLAGLDTYLDCVVAVNDGSCVAPADPVFDQQQIPLLSVYQKCISNYDMMMWDDGAFLMYNRTLQKQLKLNIPEVVDTFGVSDCLLTAKANGWDNQGCLTDYFFKGTQRVDYFYYTNISESNPASQRQDACLTFSGPAANPNPNISLPFVACLESFANRSGCDIPSIIWSGRSNNKVPVATQHTMRISDEATRKKFAMGEVEAVKFKVLSVLDKIEKEWTGDGLDITIYSAEGDSLHQVADCYMNGPLSETVFTPGPDGVEKVRWSRGSAGPTREMELPCSGAQLENRNGVRDSKPPFTCGSRARRSIMRYFIRDHLGGGKNNSAAKSMVVKAVKELINRTKIAWGYDDNYRCTCANGTRGWNCCAEQSNCAIEPCKCPDSYAVKQSVACCTSVCGGLAGAGLMDTFTSIKGSDLAKDLLSNLTEYLRSEIWTTNDPWLKYDPTGDAAYRKSWQDNTFKLSDAGMFDTTNPVVYYDETMYPFQSTLWEFCAGLLQQVMWTMPLDRKTNRPKMPSTEYDPVNGESQTVNMTYREEFIQSITMESFKQSALYWHYNVRYSPSPSEVCERASARQPVGVSDFTVMNSKATKMGFSAYTLGGVGGVDCYCGWWDSPTTCRIPDATCSRMVQLLGFNRICRDQRQVYNYTDHFMVVDALAALLKKDPSALFPCPMLRVSEHWSLMGNDGLPYPNATNAVLMEGVGGFRVGNADWLFANQANLVNPTTRVDPMERNNDAKVSQHCSLTDTSIADHFIDDLFPVAQGVRQSAPQSYCTRYGIELARLTVYKAAHLDSSVGQQQGVVDKWQQRCQLKLQQLAVCKAFDVLNATGAPQGTTQCPFSISAAVELQSSYAVTPGCLLILWNSEQSGIYDPCLCVACNGQNIDVPGDLTTLCQLQDIDTIVGPGVIPSESPTISLGSGSFMDLFTKADRMSVNSIVEDIRHWAVKTSILDGDMLLDWWPDEWRHPVGYHVTPSCSLPGDAHWKTFNSSWRWDTVTERMVFAPEVADPLLYRNSFGGGAGVCRASNYGMPMQTLNTMRVCTRENKNAKADPMVPSPSQQLPWSDGPEYCSDSASATPWNWTKTLNPPRQWSVGTMMDGSNILEPFHATEWGASCGPYPLRTCIVDGECAAGLVCLKARGTIGVCGKILAGSFECAMHSQCPLDRLCTGDGVCVEGILQVRNNLSETISFRTHSQACTSGDPLDTWGTSTTENIPDILNASGLCSYRAWYENRKMSQANLCTNSGTCSAFTGMQSWNSTSPWRMSQSDAFSDGVLKVQAYPCDRDYQHLDGFTSCTPNDNFLQLRMATGNVIAKPAGGYARGNRTRTYRVGTRSLPLMHHMDNSVGETYGFTGIPLSYGALGLGTATPAIMACRNLKVCGFQNEFRVNGVVINQRRVIDTGTTRGYTMNDLLNCGVFGYQTTSGLCKIDFAVAPLVSLFLNSFPAWRSRPAFAGVAGMTSDQYTKDQMASLLTLINLLPGIIMSDYIGGYPTTFQDYVTKSALFVVLFKEIQKLNVPTYDSVGSPRQLYYLTLYGAYETPFAWWYKCAWLAGFPMGTATISEEQCSWRTTGNGGRTTAFVPNDNRLSDLFGLPRTTSSVSANMTLKALLVKLPGIVTQAALDAALVDYVAQRNAWYDRLINLIHPKVMFMCNKSKIFRMDYSGRSTAYQLERVKQAYSDGAFDLTATYTDSTGGTVCVADACVESSGFGPSITSGGNFSLLLQTALKATTVGAAPLPLSSTLVSDDDKVVFNSLFTSSSVPQSAWDGMAAAFDGKPTGCSVVSTLYNSPSSCLCEEWSRCSSGVQEKILTKQNLPSPQPTVPPLVKFKDGDGNTLKQLDVCGSTGLVCADMCTQADAVYPRTHKVELPPGIEMETYAEIPWRCTTITCTDTTSQLHNTIVPDPFVGSSSTLIEKLLIDEYTFNQKLGGTRTNAWTSATETRERGYVDRYQTSGDVKFDAWCKDNGAYPCYDNHDVAEAGSVNMSVKVVKYFLNSKLASTITFFPCGFAPEFSEERWASIKSSYSRASQIPGVVCSTVGQGRRPAVSMYDKAYYKLAVPATSTLASSVPENVLARVRVIIENLESNLGDDESCLDPNIVCDVAIDEKERGSIMVRDWTVDQNEVACRTLKMDPVYGCTMYPGERTWMADRCVEINHQSLGDLLDGRVCAFGSFSTAEQFEDPNVNGCGCKTTNQYFHPYIADCLSDDDMDACKGKVNKDGVVDRDMRLVGRSITYTYTTLIVPCVASPQRLCRLAEELATYASTPLAVCPGQSADTKAATRHGDYQNLVRGDMLHTQISLDVHAAGDGSTVDVAPFDHVFLGLQPRRSDKLPEFKCGACVSNGNCIPCSTGQTISCPTNNISVQMRTNLWTCVNCPLVTSRYCTGDHNCKMSSPLLPLASLSTLDGWANLTADAQNFLVSTPSPIAVALEAARWLVAQVLALGVPGVGLSYIVPDFMQPTNYQSPYSYNPWPVIVYSKGMETVAGDCKTSGLMPDFTNCSYDTRRRNLRTFAKANYKVNDGIALDPGTTLIWKVYRSQMLQQNIPAWEVIGNKSGMFVSDLLDDKWCREGNMADNICYKRNVGSQIMLDVLNPGLLGAFEPLAGCDVEIRDSTRVISSVCSRCESGVEDINAYEGGAAMPCRDGFTVSGVSESLQAGSNLCGKSPTYASECLNTQGLLGRAQSVYDGKTIQNLYTRIPWSAITPLPSGLRDNVLFRGKAPADLSMSNIALSAFDIGGHYLSMLLSQSKSGDPVLNIVGMPLSSYTDAFSDAAFGLSQVKTSNLLWVNIQEAFEIDLLRTKYPDPVCTSWDCPLRRRAFYNGVDPSFRPSIPDPSRTQVLYGTKIHPTQQASSLKMAFAKDGTPVLGAYKTSNGFCACRTPPCVSCPTDLDALMGGWRSSSVLSPGACTQQVDWPYPGGTLRDKSTVSEKYIPPSCGLLDRLPAFQYRYWNSGRTVSSTKTTLDRGGVCAMGWPVISSGPLTGCYLITEDDTFMCTGVKRPVSRMKARTLDSLLYATTRPRLADCKLPPSYGFQNGASTPPEVSYGQLKRWEASRILAVDIRRRLCGNDTVCEPTKDWELPTFWANVFTKDFPAPPADDGANQTLWDEPWVACLQSANGSMQCDGVVAREEWLSARTRGPACVDAMSRSKYGSNLTRDINVCDLDATLDQFCRTIQDGRYQVYEANCLYSGQCRQQLFFYQPSTYAVDNGEFVRSTVQTFYNNSVAGACVPDFNTAEAIKATAHNLENCAALKLTFLVECIQVVRLIMEDLVELVYYVSEVVLYLFSMIGESDADRQVTMREINALLTLIKNKFMAIINSFGDIFYRIIMGGPLGKWLQGAIEFMCNLISTFISDVVYVVLCWTRAACLGFLQYVATPIVRVLGAVTFGKLDYLNSDVSNAQTIIKDNVPCKKTTMFSCNINWNEDNRTNSLLPTATRCWAGAEPGIGSLGCSSGDTCLTDELGLINCGMCVGASSMIKFGCNTLTKLCSCNVFPTGISSCSSHEECTIDSNEVDCQYVDTYLQPSYGNVPCRQCANPICMVTDSSGVGKCSCLLRPVSNQACLGIGQRVSPNAAELCLVASTTGSSKSLTTTNSYTASYRTLASAPCLILNQAQTYCMQVYTSATTSIPLVVGLSFLQRRRALLQFDDGTPLVLNSSEWDGEGQPCRALVRANESELGILEKYYRGECWRWREIGGKVVADENMTHVSPYFLVSWRDLLTTLLTPDSIIDIAAKLPSIMNSVMLHSEITQPIYIAVLYWTQLIPRDIWSNATVLEKTKSFFINQTYYFNGPTPDEPIPTFHNTTGNHTTAGRRLHSISDTVTPDMAYEWSKGPYSWPPNYVYWDKNNGPSCAVVSTAINVFKNALNTTVVSYGVPRPSVQPAVWPDLIPVMPMVNWTMPVINSSSPELVMSGVVSAFIQKETLLWFFTDAPWVPYVKSFIRCDFEVVQTCSQRRSLLLSALQVAVIFVCISFAAKLVEIPYVDAILVIFFVPWVFYSAYGYAFTCAPLVPVCLLEDVINMLEFILPSSIQWPPELITQAGCSAKECMRSCRDDKVVGFDTPEDHLAWIICEIDPKFGINLARSINQWQFLYQFQASLAQKCLVYAESESMRYTQRICFSVTIVNSSPILLAAMLLMWLAPSVFGAIAAVVQFAFNTVFTLVLFVHAGQGE